VAGLAAGQYAFVFSFRRGPVWPLEPGTCATIDQQNIAILGGSSDDTAFRAIPAFGMRVSGCRPAVSG
jgi:hypothetical protein